MTFTDILRRRAKKSQALSTHSLDSHYVLLSPVMSEKTYYLMENLNTYVFVIHANANKNDVKHACKELFDISPDSVRIVMSKQKGRSVRKLVRKSSKRAYITLPEGKTLDFIK